MFKIYPFAIDVECEIRAVAVGSGVNRAVVFARNAQVFQKLIKNDLGSGIENRPVKGYILVQR